MKVFRVSFVLLNRLDAYAPSNGYPSGIYHSNMDLYCSKNEDATAVSSFFVLNPCTKYTVLNEASCYLAYEWSHDVHLVDENA